MKGGAAVLGMTFIVQVSSNYGMGDKLAQRPSISYSLLLDCDPSLRNLGEIDILPSIGGGAG